MLTVYPRGCTTIFFEFFDTSTQTNQFERAFVTSHLDVISVFLFIYLFIYLFIKCYLASVWYVVESDDVYWSTLSILDSTNKCIT